MAFLLRARPVTRTVALDLPDGSTRKVKVTTSDARDSQQVEDGDALHAHVIPAPFGVHVNRPVRAPRGRRPLLLRNLGMPKGRQRFDLDRHTGIWRPELYTMEAPK